MEGTVKKTIAKITGLATTPYPAENTEISAADIQELRKGFIRKVYTIFTAQILITAIIFAFALLDEPDNYFFSNVYILWTCDGLSLALFFIIHCIPTVRRIRILNLTLLMIFTLTISILLIPVVNFYYFERKVMLIAAGITVVMFFGLTIFGLKTTWEFALIACYILGLQVVCLVFVVVGICTKSNHVALIYSAMGALVFPFTLVHSTQLLQFGKRKLFFLLEEYTLAAFRLHMDILAIYLFLIILISVAIHY